MFLSAILDPDTLVETRMGERAHALGVLHFLKGIRANGFLVEESTKKLSRTATREVERLALRDPIWGTLWTSILDNHVVRLRNVPVAPGLAVEPRDISEIDNQARTDVVLTSRPVDVDFRRKVEAGNYLGCPAEDARRCFLEEPKPLDEMSPAEHEDLLRRTLRFARWVRIFDKQIGKGEGLVRFRRGIEWFLDGRRRHTLFADGADGFQRIEIVTAAANTLRADMGSAERDRKAAENRDAKQQVLQHLVAPLRTRYGVEVVLAYKHDPEGIFHARHLQTPHTCLHLDRGFDLFGGERMLRNLVKCARSDLPHLAQCRRLDEWQ